MAMEHVTARLLTVALLIITSSATALPRGVDPAQAASYVPSADGTFSCLDGSKTIPFSQVNDDYCDCPADGSDEPGTAACYYGKFHCANRGHSPQTLAASFVDDGICDCCDGTDEAVGVCRNTCLDAGKAAREELGSRVQEMRAALDAKVGHVTAARERKRQWATRAGSIQAEVVAKEAEVAQLEKEHAAAQAAAAEDRERLTRAHKAELEAAAAKAKAEQEAAQVADQAVAQEETDEERGRRIASQWTTDPEAAGAAHVEGQGQESGLSEVVDAEGPWAGHEGHDDAYGSGTRDHPASGGPASPGLRPRTLWEDFSALLAHSREAWIREWQDFRRFLHVCSIFWAQLKQAAGEVAKGGMRYHQEQQSLRDRAALTAREAAVRGDLQAQLDAIGAPWRDPAWQGEAARQQQAAAAAAAGEALPAAATPEPEAPEEEDYAHGLGEEADGAAVEEEVHVSSPLDAQERDLQGRVAAAKAALEALKKEAADIARYHSSGVAYDFGPGDDAFLPLAGRCVADRGSRWVYEACFYDAAYQKEPHNPSNVVRLGSWRGWADGYTKAVFDTGDPCPGGVTRSLTVKVSCGVQERMWGGEEPATCVYTVNLATPLACNQSDLQEQLDKLAALERFEAEVRAEIEAAEAARAARASNRHTEL